GIGLKKGHDHRLLPVRRSRVLANGSKGFAPSADTPSKQTHRTERREGVARPHRGVVRTRQDQYRRPRPIGSERRCKSISTIFTQTSSAWVCTCTLMWGGWITHSRSAASSSRRSGSSKRCARWV